MNKQRLSRFLLAKAIISSLKAVSMDSTNIDWACTTSQALVLVYSGERNCKLGLQWWDWKTKFSRIRFRGLTDFIHPFMNQSTSNQADKKELWGAVQNERQKGAGRQKGARLLPSYFPLEGGRGLLGRWPNERSSGDSLLTDWRLHFWESGSCNSMKAWFGDVSVAYTTPLQSCCLLFNNIKIVVKFFMLLK